MAMREIPEPELKTFLKSSQVFSKIGDKFQGVYVSDSEGNYGQDYTFETALGDLTITLKGSLHKQLQTAALSPGDLVVIQFKSTKDVGKESPMKLFKVGVDSDFKGAPPKNGPNVALKAPAAADDSDIPF